MNSGQIPVAQAVEIAIANGATPRQVKKLLAEQGQRFNYSFMPHQGEREKARRRYQLQICENGDGRPCQGSSDLCFECLNARLGLRPDAGVE